MQAEESKRLTSAKKKQAKANLDVKKQETATKNAERALDEKVRISSCAPSSIRMELIADFYHDLATGASETPNPNSTCSEEDRELKDHRKRARKGR
jgi:hypothetical protein